MVPKLHPKGSSFKGLAMYLLHDKNNAQTSERVAWTDTRNLATADPDLAWRVQAATAMDQHRLKVQAGVSLAGRKSDKHVLHFTLAWHPDQTPDKAEMLRAADGAIAALGATDRQALLVAHNDEEHTHLHICLNRVSPNDGRHLSSSKEKLNLSRWAESYERETGIYCENRIVNNAQRDRKLYIRCPKDKARHLLNAPEQVAANDNGSLSALHREQKAKDHALAERGREQFKRQAAVWEKLFSSYKDDKTALARRLQSQLAAAKQAALEFHRSDWIALNKRQDAELHTFEALEKRFFGRLGNAVKISSQMFREGTSGTIKRSFNIVHDAHRRRAYFEEAQKRQRDTLERQQDQHANTAVLPHRAAYRAQKIGLRDQLLRERHELIQQEAMQHQELQKAWAQRNAERRAAFAEKRKPQDELHAAFARAARSARVTKESDEQHAPGHSQRSDSSGEMKKSDGSQHVRASKDFSIAIGRLAKEQDNDQEL